VSSASQQTDRQLPELWGVAEVCEELGTTTGNLDRWRGLPEPITRVKATRLWLADDIRAYREAREASKVAVG